ncbi:unnamed protein product, partial [Ectocarpus fasciculatus]
CRRRRKKKSTKQRNGTETRHPSAKNTHVRWTKRHNQTATNAHRWRGRIIKRYTTTNSKLTGRKLFYRRGGDLYDASIHADHCHSSASTKKLSNAFLLSTSDKTLPLFLLLLVPKYCCNRKTIPTNKRK